MWNVFSCAYLPSGELSLAYFLIELFVFFLLGFKSSLYILDTSSLSAVSLAYIFSQAVACVLILPTLSFREQKFLIFMKSSLSIISFMDCAFGVLFKKLSPYPRSSRFSVLLSSRSFIGFLFTFRLMLHFELIFYERCKVHV